LGHYTVNLLLVSHTAITWALVGLIWTIQIVHYPLFAQVGAETFRAYHARHTRQITWIVGPLMLAELITAGWLLVYGLRSGWFLASLGLLGLNWLCTAFVQIPLHHRLALGFDVAVHRRLVVTNTWRTAAWTLRGVCLLALFT
jgi:hypothetical protein